MGSVCVLVEEICGGEKGVCVLVEEICGGEKGAFGRREVFVCVCVCVCGGGGGGGGVRGVWESCWRGGS